MFLTKSKIFLACCVSFITGVAIHSFFEELALYRFWWFVGVCLLLVVTVFLWKWKKAGVMSLLLLFLLLGVFRYAVAVPADLGPNRLAHYHGEEVDISGYICSRVEERSDSQKFHFCARYLIGRKNGPASVTGKMVVITSKYPYYEYGEEAVFRGNPEEPEPFQGFAYDKYLAKQGIYSVSYYPELKRLADPGGGEGIKSSLYGKILDLREYLSSRIEAGLEEPEATLANAMLLGYKSAIPDSIREQFSRAGLSHIIAISGLHISILVILVFYLVMGIGVERDKAFYISSLMLLFYIILIGTPVSAVRAGLMGFLALLAVRMKRLPKAENFLIISGFIILMVNPMLLRYDVGFQLSFLAVVAILFFYPLLRKVVLQKTRMDDRNRVPRAVVEVMLVTFIIQLLIAPVVAYNFGIISLIAPVANLLVLWTLPLVLSFLIVGVVLSILLPGISIFLFLPAKLFLSYILWIGEIINRIPLSAWKAEDIELSWLIAYYVILLLIFSVWRYRNIPLN
jgi:competence protein ComEC